MFHVEYMVFKKYVKSSINCIMELEVKSDASVPPWIVVALLIKQNLILKQNTSQNSINYQYHQQF